MIFIAQKENIGNMSGKFKKKKTADSELLYNFSYIFTDGFVNRIYRS